MTSQETIVVYIVEDDDAFRKSVERLVQSFGYKTVACVSGQDFLALAKSLNPGCLLLDIRLPDIDGMDLFEILQEQGCNLPVIFMTGHGDIPMSVSAMKKGAVDFLAKPFGPEALRKAIVIAAEKADRETGLDAKLREFRKRIKGLTPRETEVLHWVISGARNKAIAEALGVSVKTIKVHRGRVMEKTRVSSLAELVRMAERSNLSSSV